MHRARSLLAFVVVLGIVASGVTAARPGHAFCGFYVAGGDTALYNNATQVALMREGTRTVLAMQNNYQGPPANFALVIPVPVVLHKENVKTLSPDIFRKLDSLTAPRLVEYWEQDPCGRGQDEVMKRAVAPAMTRAAAPGGGGAGLGVTIEAQFSVGEYEIVVLSARDSSGLDTWLRREKYDIPAGAEPYLRPYVAAGSKFFVARVDVSKVSFSDGMATLSPLRFYYDAEAFSLPIRLGLINARGAQDLIVYLLGEEQRYEVANYPNVTIPTNLDVGEITKTEFGRFYAALFDRTVERNARAVVTEYAWDASTCDPCPGPMLDASDFLTLGADALPSASPAPAGGKVPPQTTLPRKAPCGCAPADLQCQMRCSAAPQPCKCPPGDPLCSCSPSATTPYTPTPRRGPWFRSRFVVTRLHARYDKDTLGDDLVFRQAPPIEGGREFRSAPGETLEHGAKKSSSNNFQGRYAIRHPWTGAVVCSEPHRGIWGGPPNGTARAGAVQPALEIAFAPRGKVELASYLRQNVDEIDVKGTALAPTGVAPVASDSSAAPGELVASPATDGASATKHRPGCNACAVGTSRRETRLPAGLLAIGVAAALARWRRRRSWS